MMLRVCGPISGVMLAPSASGGSSREEAPPGTTTRPKPALSLNGDAALITFLIKPEKAADFEIVLTKLKEALQRSDKPERRAQAAGWQVFRSAEMTHGKAVYVMRIDQVVRGQEYDVIRLVAETFPDEVEELFARYKDAFAGRGITELNLLMVMQ
jgi:hypothetical protein